MLNFRLAVGFMLLAVDISTIAGSLLQIEEGFLSVVGVLTNPHE